MTQINETPKQRREQCRSDELVHEFVGAVSHLLMSSEFKGSALYKFLIRFARQWHIENVDLEDVVVESVMRGVEYIGKHNRPIQKPESWLRQVCLNILKGKVDAAIKDERKAIMVTTLAQHSNSPMIEAELIEQLAFLEDALNQLSEDDQMLIRMKFIQRKTYEQIRHHFKLMAEGQDKEIPSVRSLRKRESRALQRLKLRFFALYSQERA